MYNNEKERERERDIRHLDTKIRLTEDSLLREKNPYKKQDILDRLSILRKTRQKYNYTS